MAMVILTLSVLQLGVGGCLSSQSKLLRLPVGCQATWRTVELQSHTEGDFFLLNNIFLLHTLRAKTQNPLQL